MQAKQEQRPAIGEEATRFSYDQKQVHWHVYPNECRPKVDQGAIHVHPSYQHPLSIARLCGYFPDTTYHLTLIPSSSKVSSCGYFTAPHRLLPSNLVANHFYASTYAPCYRNTSGVLHERKREYNLLPQYIQLTKDIFFPDKRVIVI
jgi:hypothetical protein